MKNAARSAAKEACGRERLQNPAGSGLSVRAFCRREGLSEPSFSAWRRELDKRDRQRSAGADGRVASSAAGSAGLVAVDVIGVLGEATLEIAVAGGVVLRLREEASAETLQRVRAAAGRQRATSETLRERQVAAGGLSRGRRVSFWRSSRPTCAKDSTVCSRCEIRADELALLLEGIDLASVKRRKRYERPAARAANTSASTA